MATTTRTTTPRAAREALAAAYLAAHPNATGDALARHLGCSATTAYRTEAWKQRQKQPRRPQPRQQRQAAPQGRQPQQQPQQQQQQSGPKREGISGTPPWAVVQVMDWAGWVKASPPLDDLLPWEGRGVRPTVQGSDDRVAWERRRAA
jgi:hypothetical protein